MFVSQASIAQGGDVHSYNLKKQIEVVKNCRTVKKGDLKYNSATPKVDVDPETLVRSIFTDGEGRIMANHSIGCYLRWKGTQVRAGELSSSDETIVLVLDSYERTLSLEIVLDLVFNLIHNTMKSSIGCYILWLKGFPRVEVVQQVSFCVEVSDRVSH
jgi:hypothetical protein